MIIPQPGNALPRVPHKTYKITSDAALPNNAKQKHLALQHRTHREHNGFRIIPKVIRDLITKEIGREEMKRTAAPAASDLDKRWAEEMKLLRKGVGGQSRRRGRAAVSRHREAEGIDVWLGYLHPLAVRRKRSLRFVILRTPIRRRNGR